MVQHHFVSAWVPPQGEVRHNYTRALGHDLFAVGTLISLKEIAPGATQTNHAVLYSGPQEQARLEQLAPGLELVVDYGGECPGEGKRRKGHEASGKVLKTGHLPGLRRFQTLGGSESAEAPGNLPG